MYAISGDGLMRARYVGNISPQVLAGFVTDARAGRIVALATGDAANKVDGDTDYLRSQAEENALRDAAVKALEPVADNDESKVLLARLQGDTASAREQWPDALAAYRRGRRVAGHERAIPHRH